MSNLEKEDQKLTLNKRVCNDVNKVILSGRVPIVEDNKKSIFILKSSSASPIINRRTQLT